jgi:hypothetical protein
MPTKDMAAETTTDQNETCGRGSVPPIAANVGIVVALTAASRTAILSVFFIVESPWRGYALSEPKPSPADSGIAKYLSGKTVVVEP